MYLFLFIIKMKLLQLRYLIEVAKLQNISKAAAALCTSQPGISKQIMLLEQELQVSLFVRKGRNLSGLTPAGEQVLELAEQVMTRIKAIKQITEQLNNEPGTLAIFGAGLAGLAMARRRRRG